ADDVATASDARPVELPVTGDIPAGRPSTVSLQPRTAMRIMTGAPIPRGADAVVPVEWTDAGLAQVRVVRAAGPGAHVRPTGTDDPRRLVDTIEDQLIRSDLLVTTGGVSAGAYDVVKEILSRLGTVAFDKVAMQPGMPQGRGSIGPEGTPIFTLPGNPVSAYV